MQDAVVIVPCYNEAERINLEKFESYCQKHPEVRLLFVNDGSQDNTSEILKEFCKRVSFPVSVYDLEKNSGKAEAVRRGVLKALELSPSYVGYWDADLATPLEAITDFMKLLEKKKEIMLAMGSRIQLLGRIVERKWYRHYLGRVFATAASLVLSLPVYDTQCGAKLFRVYKEINELFEKPFLTKWIFDVELIARLMRQRRLAGETGVEDVIYEVPLLEWRDIRGSKVKVYDFIIALYDLVIVYFNYFIGN